MSHNASTPAASGPARWLWLVMLVAGCGAIAGYFSAPGMASRDFWYTAIGVASTACVLIGLRLHRPADPTAWRLIACGNLSFVLGDGVLDYYQLVLHRDAPTPSIGDLLYLAGYPLLFVGISRLCRTDDHSGARENNVDAAIVSIAALAVSWRVLMSSYAHDRSATGLGKVLTLAYPIMDLAILFVVVSALMFKAAGGPAHRLVALAMLAMLVADLGYDLLLLHGNYSDGDLIDAGWLINYLLVGAAALHPSMATKPTHRERRTSRRGWVPLVVLAGLISPAILLAGQIFGTSAADVPVFVATSAAVFALVVLRGSWLLQRIAVQNHELERRTDLLENSLSARNALEADLHHQAFHDSLTGLPNRALLGDRINHALASSVRSGNSVAVCFCDLDRFKNVNDALGHGTGDEVLVICAKRLRSVVQPSDTVARLGGDEFAILLEDVSDPAIATGTAERILAVLREPIELADRTVHLSATVGIAFSDPNMAGNAAMILANADTAMYEAKAAGRDRYQVYESMMRARVTNRLELANSFPTSLRADEFILDYQPTFDLRTGTLRGFEALVRWNHPTLGRVNPTDFIPLAEETGFVVPLGRWVLDTACATAATWSAYREQPLSISVNVSARQLRDSQLLDDVRTALSFTGLPPHQLVLEVTESSLMTDPAQAISTLARLRALGVRIAIDDFGTGHSSLSYLRQFAVDVLKIDKSFVDPLTDPTSEGAAFVATIVRLARDLGLTTVAEGIEHASQRTALIRLGCDQGQGFLLSRPLPALGARQLTEAAHRAPTRPARNPV